MRKPFGISYPELPIKYFCIAHTCETLMNGQQEGYKMTELTPAQFMQWYLGMLSPRQNTCIVATRNPSLIHHFYNTLGYSGMKSWFNKAYCSENNHVLLAS